MIVILTREAYVSKASAICDFFVKTETFVLFLACITVKNRLPVPLPLERGM